MRNVKHVIMHQCAYMSLWAVALKLNEFEVGFPHNNYMYMYICMKEYEVL